MSKCLLQNKRHCVNNYKYYKYFVFYFKYQIIPIYDINSRCGGHIYCRFETFHRLIKKNPNSLEFHLRATCFLKQISPRVHAAHLADEQKTACFESDVIHTSQHY